MPDMTSASAGTVLAFDFGKRRIGVAIGEHELRMASSDDDRSVDDEAPF